MYMEKTGDFFDIRQVVDLTGISEFTLRGWEGRYQAFQPHRTETGRRLYKREDILKIQALKLLVERGHRIGKIALLPLKELQLLLEERTSPTPAAAPAAAPKSRAHKPTSADVKKLLQLADRFEWDQVKKLLSKKRSQLTPRKFILELLMELIGEINHQVIMGHFSITQEHIFSSLIKEHLFSLRAHAGPSKKSRVQLVLATPEGDIHEIGLLIAATLASLRGVPTLYLGPNTPKVEMCDACLRLKATHLLIAATVNKTEGAKEDLLGFVHYVDQHLPPQVQLWMGGRLSQHTKALKLRRDFAVFDSLESLDLEFKKLMS